MKRIVWKRNTKHSGVKFLVPRKHTLIVEAGAFIEYESITVQGHLVFNGTESAPIICNASIVSIDDFKKVSIKATYTHFKKRVDVRSNTKLNHCFISDGFIVRAGQTIVESSEIKDTYFRLYGNDNTIDSSVFINCSGLYFYSNLVFTNNIIRDTDKKRTTGIDLNALKHEAAIRLNIGSIIQKTIIIENNVFENLPVGLSLEHKGRINSNRSSIRTLIIRLNDFYNNEVAIVWTADNLYPQVLDNNFYGDATYHYVAKPKTNDYGDKSKYSTCEINANYYDNKGALTYDHQDDFTAAYRFKIADELAFPIDNLDKKDKSRNEVVRENYYSQLPKFLGRKLINFLLIFGFLMVIMSFCAFVTAMSMTRATQQPFSEGLFLITDKKLLLFYFSISVFYTLLYRHDTYRDIFKR